MARLFIAGLVFLAVVQARCLLCHDRSRLGVGRRRDQVPSPTRPSPPVYLPSLCVSWLTVGLVSFVFSFLLL